ncbi:cAMP-binding protein [Sporocytophaga myxococcoides]|uniref:cAMP-binding protein n=1 Tax=Sporocytophaga myxococcoides TaxID=153721 RepID=A0A098LGK6_9BACT|nr:Crp/Fnr family transcriptional regulator [Sporocytophaga myxococcoides]GAL86121.1 cAMP-binding protein [Sporocytophaga myxococcoides]
MNLLIPLNNFKIYLNDKAGLTDEELAKLPYIPKSKLYTKGTLVLSKGEICKDIFFVESGLLRQYTIDSIGKDHIIHFAPESWIVSDRSGAYFDQMSEYFIEAIEDTEVVIMDETFINTASEISRTFRENNHRALHNHVRHLQKRINQLLGATAEERYLEFLKLYPNVALRVPQWMIASYLGITPESLSRVRNGLAKRS